MGGSVPGGAAPGGVRGEPDARCPPQNDGRLRLSRQGVIFKNSKTGKVDNIQASELAEGVWRRVALGHGLKLLTKNGHVYKYDGFRESVSPRRRLLPAFLLCVSGHRPTTPPSPPARADPRFSPRLPRFRGLCPLSGLRTVPAGCLTGVPCWQEFDKLSDFFKAHYRLELAEKDLCVKGWNWGTVRFGGESRQGAAGNWGGGGAGGVPTHRGACSCCSQLQGAPPGSRPLPSGGFGHFPSQESRRCPHKSHILWGKVL